MSDPTPNQTRPTTGRTTRWLLPPAASLAIHAGLLVALTAVTIEVTRDRAPDRPARVTLSAPAAPLNQSPTAPTPTARPSASDATGTTIAPPSEPASITAALADAARDSKPTPAPVMLAPEPVARALSRPSNAGSPSVRFADIDAAPARTVVFVVDASGAVATAFTFVREELLRSIDQLAPTQRFQVVVFPGPEKTAPVFAPINNGRLALASPNSKRIVAEWMQTFRPRGQSAPLAGLRMALELEPDIAMLITRSIERTGPDAAWGAGLDATLAELDRLNPIDRRNGMRRTSIAAIQLLDEDPTRIMPAIAAVHGSGVSDYRVVPAEALITPQEPTQQATGASDQNAIDAAAVILSDLDDAGTALRLFHGLPSDADQTAARNQSQRARTLAQRSPDDPRARVLIARANSMTLEPAQLEAAIAALDHELLYDADADAWRRLAMIDALAALGRFDDAIEQSNQLVRDSDEVALSGTLRARLITTRIALGAEPSEPDTLLPSPPFTDDTGATDPYWILAVAEAQVRARLRAHHPDPIAPLVLLLERAEQESAPGWVPILTERIARVADLDPDALRRAPARAKLLAAESWARSPATRDRAQAMLAELAGTPSPQQPDALWRLAVLERSEGTDASIRSAAQRLATLAERFPQHPNAPDALAGAIALTQSPADLRRLLRLAIASRTDRPEIELWRLQLGELSERAARLDALDLITPGTREATIAHAMYTKTAERMLAAPGASPEQQAETLERAANFLARHNDPSAADWLARAAHAALDVNTDRALVLAERSVALSPDGSSTAALTAALALIALDRPEEASPRLVDLATRLDAAADRSDTFWHAWTLLLETAGPSDPASARAHLARLELIDPDLGGEPWRSRLNALKRTLPEP